VSKAEPLVVVVTGAAGFLGSSITADLARSHSVIAVDRREPDALLLHAAPGVEWAKLDIAEADEVAAVFQGAKRRLGRIDVVIHLAAFYHFGADAHPEYERTNVRGTAHVLRAATDVGATRLIFASSVAAMEPAPPGQVLDESSPTSDYLPYAASKSTGERMVLAALSRLPAIVLRIGGVFSDWCELPPLHGLIKNWWGKSPLCRVIAGRGESGMPYVHRDDLVTLVRNCVEREAELAEHEVFIASQHGAVLQRDLFPVVRQACGGGASPLFVSPAIAGLGLRAKRLLGALSGNAPFEQPWMLEFLDRPWVVDTSSTRARLQWACTPGLDVCERLPTILEHLAREPKVWEHRNALRLSSRPHPE